MEHLKFKFWINLGFMMATTYVIILYIFTPSNNQCQMTFMMEPPRFIPVPVDHRDDSLSYPHVKNDKSSDTEVYKLFMYSEFGFPQEPNVRRDLKDSMPVLFVPGNAGSYQQVRSLASTCIRRQLQSLKAYKFIFYTIDFGGQLSGLDGQLVKEQTSFVARALEQIKHMHPAETNGIILIGHSVGGFISKALFTLPNFDPSSVPLLISLASPLIKPYLTFDDEMKTLYSQTNAYWNRHSSLKHNSTTSISITGGRPDRLVPMHLSFDPNYDLSLATSSIKDVWLETDHVSVTWCKQLINKLSHLLSAVMDKKQTQVIADKMQVLSIIREELLLERNASKKETSNVISKDWKSMRPYTLISFDTFSTLSRSQLKDSIIVVDVSSYIAKDLLIVIDHLDDLKENKMFQCREFHQNNSQINCAGRVDLIDSIKSIPTREYEPRRSVLELKSIPNNPFYYLVFDLSSYSITKNLDGKLPEMITIQELDNSNEKNLYIPTILEFIIKKMFFIDNYSYKMDHLKRIPLVYDRYRIINLDQDTQAFLISYKSNNCRSSESPSGATIILSHGVHISQSFYSTPTTANLSIDIRLVPQTLVKLRDESIDVKDSYLEFYVDGTCDNQLDVEFDLLGLAVDGIQRSLDKILTCAFYLAYSSSVFLLINLRLPEKEIKEYRQLVLKLSGLLILYLLGDSVISKNMPVKGFTHDAVLTFIVIYFLSQGIVTTLGYFINRLLDLATIINNAQSIMRMNFNAAAHQNSNSTSTTTTNGTHQSKSKPKENVTHQSDFGWLLVILAITGSIMFSNALISLFMLFTVIKSKLCIISHQINDKTESLSKNLGNNKHFRQEAEEAKVSRRLGLRLHEFMISIATLCALALISDIPAMIKIKFNITTLHSMFQQFSIVSSLSLCCIKMICDKVEALNGRLCLKEREEEETSMKEISLVYSFSKHFAYIGLVFIPTIEANICSLKLPLLLLLGWVTHQLKCAKVKEKMN